MKIKDFILLGLIAIAVIFAIRYIIKNKNSGGCCGNCTSCKKNKCNKKAG